MKVTFFGSSYGAPTQTRRCCSLMLTVGEKHYIFDAGVMLAAELNVRNVDLHDLKAVFISHMHGDHTHGLFDLVDLMMILYKDISPEFWTPQSNTREAVRAWLQVNHDDDMETLTDFKTIEEGKFYDDGVVSVTAIRNSHLSQRPSYSFEVVAENKRIVITGDMGNNGYDDFPKCAFEKHCDLVISEGAHCKLTECENLFAKLDTDRLVFYHISPWNVSEAEKVAEKLPFQTCTSYDGMEIVID